MDTPILVGTESGLWQLRGDALEPVDLFTARTITALAKDGHGSWAIVDGRALWHHAGGPGDGVSGGDGPGGWRERASVDGHPATSVVAISGAATAAHGATAGGVLIGTEQAHLLRFVDGASADALARVEAFEAVEGRDTWHTPWGDPADVRSMAVGLDGTVYVNVHVGGVVRSRDGGRSWMPTLDIDVDVHQVIAHPSHAEVVLVAAYDGFGVSRDGGDSWRFITEGMHAHYGRAVAVSGEMVLASMSTGPSGRKSALYRRPLDADTPFERCEGLPWFDDNIDTGCLAAHGALVVFGTEDGRVFRSLDSGGHWSVVAKGLPTVRAVTVG